MDREAFRIAERSGQNAGMRFYAACDETFARIATYPEIGKIQQFENPSLLNVRVWQVKEFREYLVFYRSLKNKVEILNVIHGSRDIEAIFEQEFGE